VKVGSRERHIKRTLVFALHSSLALVVSNYKVYTRVRAAGRDKTLAYCTALLFTAVKSFMAQVHEAIQL
jgi:hypothetical protein